MEKTNNLFALLFFFACSLTLTAQETQPEEEVAESQPQSAVIKAETQAEEQGSNEGSISSEPITQKETSDKESISLKEGSGEGKDTSNKEQSSAKEAESTINKPEKETTPETTPSAPPLEQPKESAEKPLATPSASLPSSTSQQPPSGQATPQTAPTSFIPSDSTTVSPTQSSDFKNIFYGIREIINEKAAPVLIKEIQTRLLESVNGAPALVTGASKPEIDSFTKSIINYYTKFIAVLYKNIDKGISVQREHHIFYCKVILKFLASGKCTDQQIKEIAQKIGVHSLSTAITDEEMNNAEKIFKEKMPNVAMNLPLELEIAMQEQAVITIATKLIETFTALSASPVKDMVIKAHEKFIEDLLSRITKKFTTYPDTEAIKKYVELGTKIKEVMGTAPKIEDLIFDFALDLIKEKNTTWKPTIENRIGSCSLLFKDKILGPLTEAFLKNRARELAKNLETLTTELDTAEKKASLIPAVEEIVKIANTGTLNIAKKEKEKFSEIFDSLKGKPNISALLTKAKKAKLNPMDIAAIKTGVDAGQLDILLTIAQNIDPKHAKADEFIDYLLTVYTKTIAKYYSKIKKAADIQTATTYEEITIAYAYILATVIDNKIEASEKTQKQLIDTATLLGVKTFDAKRTDAKDALKTLVYPLMLKISKATVDAGTDMIKLTNAFDSILTDLDNLNKTLPETVTMIFTKYGKSLGDKIKALAKKLSDNAKTVADAEPAMTAYIKLIKHATSFPAFSKDEKTKDAFDGKILDFLYNLTTEKKKTILSKAGRTLEERIQNFTEVLKKIDSLSGTAGQADQLYKFSAATQKTYQKKFLSQIKSIQSSANGEIMDASHALVSAMSTFFKQLESPAFLKTQSSDIDQIAVNFYYKLTDSTRKLLTKARTLKQRLDNYVAALQKMKEIGLFTKQAIMDKNKKKFIDRAKLLGQNAVKEFAKNDMKNKDAFAAMLKEAAAVPNWQSDLQAKIKDMYKSLASKYKTAKKNRDKAKAIDSKVCDQVATTKNLITKAKLKSQCSTSKKLTTYETALTKLEESFTIAVPTDPSWVKAEVDKLKQ